MRGHRRCLGHALIRICARAGSGQASTSGRAWDEGERQPGGGGGARWRALPRADVLVLGGDLAYPNPSTETYEQRFFAPFEAALPPPPVRRCSSLGVLCLRLQACAPVNRAARHTVVAMRQAADRGPFIVRVRWQVPRTC